MLEKFADQAANNGPGWAAFLVVIYLIYRAGSFFGLEIAKPLCTSLCRFVDLAGPAVIEIRDEVKQTRAVAEKLDSQAARFQCRVAEISPHAA